MPARFASSNSPRMRSRGRDRTARGRLAASAESSRSGVRTAGRFANRSWASVPPYAPAGSRSEPGSGNDRALCSGGSCGASRERYRRPPVLCGSRRYGWLRIEKRPGRHRRFPDREGPERRHHRNTNAHRGRPDRPQVAAGIIRLDAFQQASGKSRWNDCAVCTHSRSALGESAEAAAQRA